MEFNSAGKPALIPLSISKVTSPASIAAVGFPAGISSIHKLQPEDTLSSITEALVPLV